MPDHPNATFVRNMLDVLSSGDLLSLSDMLDDNVVWHEIGNPNAIHGKAALAARATDSPPDWTITGEVHDVVANDDHTVALVTATGTRGGRTLTYRVAELYHIRDNKVTERWAFSDDTAAITAFFA